MIDYNYTIKKKLEGGKMSELNFMYWINVYESGSVSMWGEHSIEDAECHFNASIRRCKGAENKVVLSHSGSIFTGTSRCQAELALSYLQNNYPTYTNFRVCGTGEWDAPYSATMEKTLKVYDARSKKIYNVEADDEK